MSRTWLLVSVFVSLEIALSSCARTSTQALFACRQYVPNWTDLDADSAGQYANFQVPLSASNGDILVGVQKFAAGSGWNILRLPAAQNNLSTGATSWTVADSVAPPGGTNDVRVVNATQDPIGNIYFMGTTYMAGVYQHWWVRMSKNNGVSFTQSDDYSGADIGGTNAFTFDGGGFSDQAGNVYALGGVFTTSVQPVIRRSANSGASWTTIEATQFTAGFTTEFSGMTQLPNGNLIAVAQGSDAGGFFHGLVYVSVDGGLTFNLQTNYFPNAGKNTFFNSVTTDSSGNLLITSTQQPATSADGYWQVLRSTDGGVTLTVVDNYVLATGQGANDVDPFGIYRSGAGVYYSHGWAIGSGGLYHGIVRSSPDGVTWSTYFDTGPAFEIYGMGADVYGDLFVTGAAASSGTVKRLDCLD